MAQQTQLTVSALPGRVQSFVAKAVATGAREIFEANISFRKNFDDTIEFTKTFSSNISFRKTFSGDISF
jgi:hypothetical protein